MSTKMNLAPVFYTLAQIKFNPIEQMSSYIPRIQEELRQKGYPDYLPETQLAVAVRRLEQDQPEIKSQQNMRWSFSNVQRTEGYLILSNALIFHTTLYDSFEKFSEKLTNGLSLVHEAIGLSYIERIGLRYLNAIIPDNNKKLADYLHPSLSGFSSAIDGALKHNFTETVIDASDGTLVARAVIVENGLALPPDLSPLQLKIQQKFSTVTGRAATLDTDHFLKLRINFNLSSVKTQLLKSHEVINKAFHAAVTDYARKSWR